MESGSQEAGNSSVPRTNAPQPAARSCRKMKSDPNASFLDDMKDHFNEFVSASMEDHKNCFMNTFGKMFAKPKQETTTSPALVETVLPLQATTSK